jgi:hypothetical protein
MRPARRCLLPTALILTLVPACAEQATSPVDPGTPALATRTSHDNVRVEFSLLDVDNPCTAAVEAIDLEGIIHGQGSQWDNDHFKSHFNVNLTGVDGSVRYQGASTGNGKGEFPGSETEDVVISTVLNNNGGKPHFVAKIVLHHHKNGTVTVDKSGEACRG